MFSVSTRTQYGIRALVYLARNESATSSEIAGAEGISHKYLEGILTALKSSGLIHSERGAHGGYTLAKNPANVTMLEIVFALEGEVVPVDCITHHGTCDHAAACQPKILWQGLKDVIDAYLASRSLRDVAERMI